MSDTPEFDPTNYDPWEQLQSTLIKTQNRIVREEFNDLGGDDWIPNIATSRAELRLACTLLDNDTATMTKLRLDLFYLIMRKAKDFHPPIYGIPSMEFINNFSFFPQIVIHFEEDRYEAATSNRLPATAQVAVRWFEESYTKPEINQLALKIRQDFAIPPFMFKKGRILFTYTDKKKGYYFQVYAFNEIEAKSVIERAYRLQHNVEPEWDEYLRDHQDKKNYTIQKTKMIMGELKQLPKRRPIADVKFSYAELKIPDLLEPIILVDRTGTHPNAIHYV
jgi:hypothetical protein